MGRAPPAVAAMRVHERVVGAGLGVGRLQELADVAVHGVGLDDAEQLLGTPRERAELQLAVDEQERPARARARGPAPAWMRTPRPQRAQTRERAAIGVGGDLAAVPAELDLRRRLDGGRGRDGAAGARAQACLLCVSGHPASTRGRHRDVVELEGLVQMQIAPAAFEHVGELARGERRGRGQVACPGGARALARGRRAGTAGPAGRPVRRGRGRPSARRRRRPRRRRRSRRPRGGSATARRPGRSGR